MEKFPVGAVVYLFTNKEVLMTVMSHEEGDDAVVVAWFDKQDCLHGETLPAAALKVRVTNPKDE